MYAMKLKNAVLHIESTCKNIQIIKTLICNTKHTESAMLKIDSLLLAKLAACSRWLPITVGFQYDLNENR